MRMLNPSNGASRATEGGGEARTARLRVMPHPRFRRADTNPYQAHLYDALADHGVEVVRFDQRTLRRGRIDVLHVHWPEYYAGGPRARVFLRRSAAAMADLLAVRLRKTAVVWTAHNLRPHDWKGRLHERLYWFVFRRQIHGVLFLSAASRDMAFERHPELARVPHRVAPHGVYTELSGDGRLSRTEARRRLDLPQGPRLALTIGEIRRYKRVGRLIQTFVDQPQPGVELVAAGRVWEEDLRREVTSLAGDQPTVHLRLDRLSDEEFATHLAAADVVVVQPAVVNSGVALAALSVGRPVLMGDSPSAHELRSLAGATWVGIVPDLPTPEMIIDIVEDQELETDSAGRDLTPFRWDRIAETTRSLYDDALRHARRRRPGGRATLETRGS